MAKIRHSMHRKGLPSGVEGGKGVVIRRERSEAGWSQEDLHIVMDWKSVFYIE